MTLGDDSRFMSLTWLDTCRIASSVSITPKGVKGEDGFREFLREI